MRCPVCPDRGFDKAYNYRRHILTIHPGTEWADSLKESTDLPNSLLGSYVRPKQKTGPKPKPAESEVKSEGGRDWLAYRNPEFGNSQEDVMDPKNRVGVPDNQCHLCKKIFAFGQKDVRRHIAQVHQAVKEFLCPECGKGFHCLSHLKRHVQGVHETGGSFKCEHCPKSYLEERHLNVHIRTVHEGAKDFMVTY